MDPMVRTVHRHVTTNVMVVTRCTVTVIGDVNQDGGEATVNIVMHLLNTII